MPGPILHMGATVLCSHGGQAVPTALSHVVLVSGMPAATITAPYVIAGCAFVPIVGNGPCVTGQWILGTVRVVSHGHPLPLMPGVSICIPTGPPSLSVVATADEGALTVTVNYSLLNSDVTQVETFVYGGNA